MSKRSYADIRTRFAKQLKALSSGAAQRATALKDGQQPKQVPLDKNGWDGNATAMEAVSKPFDRQEHNEDVTKAVSNPEKPGVIGDLTISAMQGDWLAAHERSFRMQHASRIRRQAHAAARKYGHGHDGGVLQRGLMHGLQLILERSKEQDA